MDCPIVAELKILVGPEAGRIFHITAEKVYCFEAGLYTLTNDASRRSVFRGGPEAYDTAHKNNWLGETHQMGRLVAAADSLNFSWRKPAAPRSIDGHDVTYRADGIKIGCQSLTLAQMEAMVAECKKSA